VATQCHTQKNFVTIVTRLGLKNGGKLIRWRRRQPRVRGRQCLFARSRSAANAVRPSQRGDRMTAWFAAVHESVVGTNRTNRTGLTMSVDRARPEVISRPRGPILPSTQVGIHANLENCPTAASVATVRVSTGNNFRARFLVTLRKQRGPPARTNLRRNSVRASHDQSGSTHCWLPLVAAR
jgi:hypothetical protein